MTPILLAALFMDGNVWEKKTPLMYWIIYIYILSIYEIDSKIKEKFFFDNDRINASTIKMIWRSFQKLYVNEKIIICK